MTEPRPLRPRRSNLAVPGSNPRFLEKAKGLPADVVSLLVARSRGNADLARLVLASPHLPFQERCSLFLETEPQERAAIASGAA